MTDRNKQLQFINTVFTNLEQWAEKIEYAPIIDLMSSSGKSPWQILVSTMMSSRTKDDVTAAASRRLFEKAPTPETLLDISEEEVAKLIYPVGFYKTKAKNLRKLAQRVIEEFNSSVPEDLDQLVTLPGIGIKTATLVYIKAFNKPEICVDTHVHRISNMWNLVNTKTPEETRFALKKTVPEKYWKVINQYMVTLGQVICGARKQHCCQCPVSKECPKEHC